MGEIFIKLLNMSISASYLVLAVMLLRLILKRAPRAVIVLLWGLVALRLLCPVSIESVMSLLPSGETVPMDITWSAQLVSVSITANLPMFFSPRWSCK